MSTDYSDCSMLDLFRIEAENHSRVLESGLVELEAQQIPENIEPLMRAAHSIKGAARIVGLGGCVGLAHAMEDVLSAAQHGKLHLSAGHIDSLLKGNDIFKHLAGLQAGELEPWITDNAAVLEELAAALRETLTGAPARPATASPQESPAAAAPEPRPEQRDERFVRVLADNLNRLMGYAGESLVQARSLKPLTADLFAIKAGHRELAGMLAGLCEQAQTEGASETVRLRLHDALQDLERTTDQLLGHMQRFDQFSRRTERTAEHLYDEVVASRMRPFADGLHGLPRMVRDLAQAAGKKIALSIQGEATRVDRDILEKLEAPLTHLLRNSIDHGIEPPAERAAAGKEAEGSLIVEAAHRAGMLTISVRDDGRGIDPEHLREKVLEKGYSTAEIAAGLTTTELMEFLFLPGFSTAGTVTELSGRGVGLDIVFTMAQKVGGTVRVDSQPGRGTVFDLQLPLTLSVLRTLLVDIAGEPYALPLTRIDRILSVDEAELGLLEDRQFCRLEGESVGIIDAAQVLGLSRAGQRPGKLHIAVISDRLNRYGLVVDRFMGQQDLVVIPLDPRLGSIPAISAGAIIEDGSPVLILDADDLVRAIDNLLTQGKPYKMDSLKDRASSGKRVLIVDDSLTVREVERKILENRGYEVTVAVDGIDGWNQLQSAAFDLVLTDVDMPRMNGIELVRRMKQDARLREVPVMIISYKDREEDRLLGLEAGADYYLAKSSFHDDTLITAVQDLIGEA